MKYSTGEIGRVVWARMDDGDDLRDSLLELAAKENIGPALLLVLGAVQEGRMASGPLENKLPPLAMETHFSDGREILGVGTLAPGGDGPALHLHFAAGRRGQSTKVGCLRSGTPAYLLIECVVLEMRGIKAERVLDRASGFEILDFFDD